MEQSVRMSSDWVEGLKSCNIVYCRALSHSNLTRRIPLDDASKCSFVAGTCVPAIKILMVPATTVQRTRMNGQAGQAPVQGSGLDFLHACMARFGDASHVCVDCLCGSEHGIQVLHRCVKLVF